MRLLYFSPVPADSYAQRPHFMARAWLDWGAESVLWVNPYPCRLPRWRDFVARIERSKLHRENGSKAKKTKVGSVSIDPPFDSGLDARVRVIAAPALPVEPLPGGAWWNRRFLWRGAWREIEQFAMTDTLVIGIGRPCALALEAIRRLVPAASFYDAMDNFPEFYGGLSRRALRRREDAIAAEVDLVVASSSFLAEKFARRGLRVETIFNACEGTSTLQISQTPRPAIPVLGYVGCIGDWFDWPLVARLAEALPEARIELIGPCAAPPRRTPPLRAKPRAAAPRGHRVPGSRSRLPGWWRRASPARRGPGPGAPRCGPPRRR